MVKVSVTNTQIAIAWNNGDLDIRSRLGNHCEM